MARVHADAAYGGYFKLCTLNEARNEAAFAASGHADSVVIDPHKHGLQPYGCGAVLFKNPKEGKFYKHDSPYTYFTSTSSIWVRLPWNVPRPGAVAAALWATLQKFPLDKGGEFAQRLSKACRCTRLDPIIKGRRILGHGSRTGYMRIQQKWDKGLGN